MNVLESRASTILFNLACMSPPGGVWLLPANVCPIVPLAYLKAGRSFELVDIEPQSLCIDPEATLSRLGSDPSRYAGLVFVRTYGLARSFDDFFARVREVAPALLIVDDRCLCWPSLEHEVRLPVDVVLYSTGYAKPVDLGYGGYAALRDGVPYDSRRLDFDRQQLETLEASFKQAIASRRRLTYVDGDWLDTREPRTTLSGYREQVARELELAREHKRRLNAVYRDGLPDSIVMPAELDTWRFQIRVPRKDVLLRDLFDHGLFASSHYASLAGIFDDGAAPQAERLHDGIVNLFNDRYYDERQARRTVDRILRHLGH